MIQRRVKWKKGVAAENGVQAGKGLGNSREAGGGVGWAEGASVGFKAWGGTVHRG